MDGRIDVSSSSLGFTSTETIRLTMDGRIDVSSSSLGFTSTETIRLTMDGRMEVSSSSMMFYVHRNHKDYYGRANGGVFF